MQQHPIPQNISAYQFRLVGDMTLKQFLEILGGIAVAALFYYTNLVGPIKWALMIFSVLTGLALAFMPIEERPLDQWFLAFIRTIYAPTLFIWKKTSSPPKYLTHTAKSAPLPADTQAMIEASVKRKKAGLSTFLMTLPQVKAIGALEQSENSSLQSIMNLFSNPAPLPPKPPTSTFSDTLPITFNPINTTITPAPETPSPPQPKSEPLPPLIPRMSDVPVVTPIHIQPTAHPSFIPITTPTPTAPTTGHPQPQKTLTPMIAKPSPAIPATHSQQLPFPSRPITPNTVVGMVLDKTGKIVDNAIIEIRDKNNQPVRATKTNKLGQFFSTTPLKNGPYELEVESPGHTYSLIKLKLDGTILDPLKITTKD